MELDKLLAETLFNYNGENQKYRELESEKKNKERNLLVEQYRKE